MLIKVCGMREEGNIASVASLGISMMGFIFFERSPRFVEGSAPTTPEGIVRVGVFVNASLGYIKERIESSNLHYVQLHGSESVELCGQLRELGVGVIKAISVESSSDIEQAKKYDGETDYLLFDTKCSGYGGSGVRFNWSVLDSYQGGTPFLLSGGIDETMASEIAAIKHNCFAGVDLNSRFEISPALKDIDKLEKFIEKLKQ